MLGELADLAMDLARDMAGKAKEATSLDDAERYTLAFDRMARSVRLSISLSRRLERETVRESAQRHAEVVDLKKAKLRARLRSEIAEADAGFKATLELERELDAALAEDALYASFVDLPLEEAITKLREKLGLNTPDPPLLGEVDRASRRETEGGRNAALLNAKPLRSTTICRSP